MPDFAAALSDLTGAPPSAADRALAALNATAQPRGRFNNPYDVPGAPSAAVGMPSGNPYDQFDSAPGAGTPMVAARGRSNNFFDKLADQAAFPA
jgi:hypothetical protein